MTQNFKGFELIMHLTETQKPSLWLQTAKLKNCGFYKGFLKLYFQINNRYLRKLLNTSLTNCADTCSYFYLCANNPIELREELTRWTPVATITSCSSEPSPPCCTLKVQLSRDSLLFCCVNKKEQQCILSMPFQIFRKPISCKRINCKRYRISQTVMIRIRQM